MWIAAFSCHAITFFACIKRSSAKYNQNNEERPQKKKAREKYESLLKEEK